MPTKSFDGASVFGKYGSWRMGTDVGLDTFQSRSKWRRMLIQRERLPRSLLSVRGRFP